MLRLEATLRKERGSMDKPFVYVTRKLPEEQLSALKEEARIDVGKGRRTVPARRSGGKSKKGARTVDDAFRHS